MRSKKKDTSRADETRRSDRPEDRIGFLLALPLDATAQDVSRFAFEFGIKGAVEVKTYTRPDDNISFQIIERDPGYVVTCYPRDMEGCLGRLADKLLERIGRSLVETAPPRKPLAIARTGFAAPALPRSSGFAAPLETSRTEAPTVTKAAPGRTDAMASDDLTPEEMQRLAGIFRLLLKWEDERRKRRAEK